MSESESSGVGGSAGESAAGDSQQRPDQLGPVKAGSCELPGQGLTKEEAFFRILNGHWRYLQNKRRNTTTSQEDRARHAEGQYPFAAILGCADSRVSPEVIFDARPGELFVVRNVANLVPPFETGGLYHGTSAALEFAVQALRVKHIVVLGHGRCGGIRAYADEQSQPLSPGDFIGKWISLIDPVAEKLGARKEDSFDDYVEKLAHASIENTL